MPHAYDTLLDGRVRLRQPETGFRASIDSVFLAGALTPKPGTRALDAGCGHGAALLCLAHRCRKVKIDGLEIDDITAEMARENLCLNGMETQAAIYTGSLFMPPEEVAGRDYDAVITNPPYAPPGTAAADPDRARACSERPPGDLAGWLSATLKRLKFRGELAVVHRADQVPALLAALSGRVGDLRVVPLWPRPGLSARRVVVFGRKGTGGAAEITPGICVHPSAGSGYTPAARKILHDGGALDQALSDSGESR